MRVLFCTDGSQISYNALENYVNVAKKDVVIDIISVIDWSFLPDNSIIEDSCFTSTCRNMADDILKTSKEIVTKKGFQTGDLIKLCGNAIECILEQLKSKKYDTVILGSRGKKGLQRWIGSVSKSVLDEGETTTYISTNRQCCNRILFIADGTETSKLSAEQTIKLLKVSDCSVYICSVSETPDFLFLNGTLDSNWLNTIHTQQNVSSQIAISKVTKVFETNGIQITETKVLNGIPAASIIDYAKENEINLIVTGVKPRSKMHKFLLDSVSKRVLENTSSDMLVNFML